MNGSYGYQKEGNPDGTSPVCESQEAVFGHNRTDQHVYYRIATALNDIYAIPATYEDAEAACEKLHEQGLNVQTYAEADTVANVLRHLNLV